MLKLKVVCLSLGLWAAVSFVVCVIWGLVMPESLHMHALLEQMLPAFKWLTWWGFLLGLVESFLLGAYAGLVYVPIHNVVNRRWGAPTSNVGQKTGKRRAESVQRGSKSGSLKYLTEDLHHE